MLEAAEEKHLKALCKETHSCLDLTAWQRLLIAGACVEQLLGASVPGCGGSDFFDASGPHALSTSALGNECCSMSTECAKELGTSADGRHVTVVAMLVVVMLHLMVRAN